MNIFLDTSVLVKLYHKEDGTEKIFAKINESSPEFLILSELSQLEFRSAFLKKVRLKEIEQDDVEKVIDFFSNDIDKFVWLSIDKRVKDLALESLSKHGLKGLRTLDSLQLASALIVKERLGDTLYLTSDKLLSKLFISEDLNTELI